MRYFLFLFLILISGLSFSYDQEKLIKAWASSVMVRGYTETGALAYGSGVIVGKDQVVTNCHVLRKTKSPWISHGNTSFSVTGVQADHWRDLCLLTVFNLNREPVPMGSCRNLKKGQEMFGIGHSNGAPVPLTTGGYIIASYKYEDENIILSSTKFRMGASGSGLYDVNGNLVGINTFKPTGYGAYYSMPVEWIKPLMKKEIETKFPISGKALWEEKENKKPYFLQIAIPKMKENWSDLLKITKLWIKKDEKNTEAWYEYGFVNEKLKNQIVAIDAYNKSISLDSNNSDSLLGLALIMKKIGNLKKVKVIEKKLKEIDPNKAYELNKNN
jgi:serine protease Do